MPSDLGVRGLAPHPTKKGIPTLKNLLLAFALVGCVVACNTEKRSVSDAAAPNAPKAECSEGMKADCSDAAKAECSGMKKACCADKSKPQG